MPASATGFASGLSKPVIMIATTPTPRTARLHQRVATQNAKKTSGIHRTMKTRQSTSPRIWARGGG